MFGLTRKDHCRNSSNSFSTAKNNSIEDEGVIQEVIRQGKEWWIYFPPTYWFARSTEPIELFPGDVVRVVGRNNLTLLIERIPSDQREPTFEVSKEIVRNWAKGSVAATKRHAASEIFI